MSVVLSLYSPGCDSTACVCTMDSLNTIINLADFDVKASLSNKSEQKLRSERWPIIMYTQLLLKAV